MWWVFYNRGMKFLLVAINAKYIHSNPAIYSLKAFVGREAGRDVELAEYTINQYSGEILADIYRRKPDVVGFSCYIWNWNMVKELLPELPKVLPGVRLWLGGPEVSFDADKILREYPQLSGVMVGEGEKTFQELLAYYSEGEAKKADGAQEAAGTGQADGVRGSALAQIPGLCLPEGYTPARELTNMSEIPFLYEDMEPFKNRILYYESGRGCPYRCSYCLSSIDREVRLRDIDMVRKELQFFLDSRVPQVKFVDRTFNCNHEHAMAIWQYLYEHDNGVTNFHFEISADILREDEIQLLQKLRPGLVQLEIGVQSANPRSIEAVSRVMDLDRLAIVVARIREGRNIHQHLDLIVGLPFEDYESFGRSFDRVYAMRPDQLQMGFLKVLKGSPLHGKTEEYGIYYLDRPPYEVLSTRWLSFEDVLKLKQIEEMVGLYYNSSQFTHTLAFLERLFSSPFAMFEALAGFYERTGHTVGSSSRAYRYQVLLDFAKERDKTHEAEYRELLTYDLYLREKLKSRPEFAGELTALLVKASIRDFYKEEERKHRFLSGYEGCDRRQLGRMTHLEPFWYPVWNPEDMKKGETAGQAQVRGRETAQHPLAYLLFDYRSKSPLTGEAAVSVISWEEMQRIRGMEHIQGAENIQKTQSAKEGAGVRGRED